MPTKNAVRADLNRLRKLCKSINTIEYYHVSSGEPIQDSPLEEQLTGLTAKRDKIYKRYAPGIDTLDPTEALIFTLYYLEGNTQKQVATKTNYSKSSITKHLAKIELFMSKK